MPRLTLICRHCSGGIEVADFEVTGFEVTGFEVASLEMVCFQVDGFDVANFKCPGFKQSEFEGLCFRTFVLGRSIANKLGGEPHYSGLSIIRSIIGFV